MADEEKRARKRQEDLPTEHVLSKIRGAQDIDDMMERNKEVFTCKPISEHLEMLLKKYCVNKNEAIERADLEKGYGYQILRGEREARRDKYIRLAFGIGLTLEDTQRLLTVAKHGLLYPKMKRDAVVIFCIEKGYDLMKLQLLLDAQGFEPLG